MFRVDDEELPQAPTAWHTRPRDQTLHVIDDAHVTHEEYQA